jgi:hypothetical protein
MNREPFTMRLGLALVATYLTLGPAAAHAHFAWLATDHHGHAIYFFGESIADQTYHLPEKMAGAAVHRYTGEEKQPIELTAVDSDSFIGRRSAEPIADSSVLLSVQPYGLYHGSMLVYHTQHITGAPDKWNKEPLAEVALQAVLVMSDEKLVARILHHGKPLAGAKVQLFCDEGHEEGTAETNEQGEVEFTAAQVEDGLNGLLVGHVDKQAKGELEGQAYQGEANYLTVTFKR